MLKLAFKVNWRKVTYMDIPHDHPVANARKASLPVRVPLIVLNDL